MKLPCHVIEDLLPLYHDRVCSPESASLVEEHLSQCEACTGTLSKMREDQAPAAQAIDDAAPLRAIGASWKNGKRRAFVKGTAIAVLSCAILIGAYLGLTQWKCIPVPKDLLEVTQVSSLSDGRIIYHLNVKDDRDLHFIKFTTDSDGTRHITPMRSVIEEKRKMETGLFNDYHMVDIAENNAYQQRFGEGVVITSCYLGPSDDGILIWKEGMELPPASAELEQLVN